ncbi:MAG: FFLEELY motif protein [Burkholderiaceae bacterium]
MARGLEGSAKERLGGALQRVIALRRRLDADPVVAQRWRAVKSWQSQRLRQTYPDLLASPRYGPACRFFLEELYGAKDFSQRDNEALRVAPKLARMLPDRAIETMALAVELDELSETLDARVAGVIRLPIDEASYAEAYRAAGTREERARQIEMIDRIGRSLERLARIPFLSGMLHMMRAPAEAAGLGHLHHFLASGFDSFKAMGDAGEFLAAIRERETALMREWFGD